MAANPNAASVHYWGRDRARTTMQDHHDLRTSVPAYVDPQRSEGNTVLHFTDRPLHGASLWKEINGQRKKAGLRGLRKDANVTISGILTFGREAQAVLGTLSPEEQDARILQAVRDQEKVHGHPLLQLVIHRDESALHAHMVFLGYREEGTKPWRMNRTDLSRLQDRVAESFRDLGITRGRRVYERLQDGENYADLVQKSVNELHRELEPDIQKAKQRLEEIRFRSENLRVDPLVRQTFRVVRKRKLFGGDEVEEVDGVIWEQAKAFVRQVREKASEEAIKKEKELAEREGRLRMREHSFDREFDALLLREKEVSDHMEEMAALKERVRQLSALVPAQQQTAGIRQGPG